MEDLIAFLPTSAMNPYISLLQAAVESCGVRVEPLPSPITQDWLREHQGDRSVLHYHWPSYEFTASGRREMRERLAMWTSHLRYARELDYGVVWTVHNLYPHEQENRDLQREGRCIMIECATGLLVHCRYAAEQLESHFRVQIPISVIPFGSYEPAFDGTVDTRDARGALSLDPTSFVYLSFGLIRSYNGIDNLIAEFRGYTAPHTELVIAGLPVTKEAEDLLHSASQSDARIRVFPRFLDREAVRLVFQPAMQLFCRTRTY